jgi:glycerol-3-phosphate dehydrogenase
MPSDTCDLLIVGAGINGAGIARDAVLRGFNVIVCDCGDIAGGTSSASTKLIHGGLRYLEQGAFRLVRESLHERETLGRIAAHLVRPQRFIVPHTGQRPAWLLALGLRLYDFLAGASSLPKARRLDATFPALACLAGRVRGAHAYHDLWVDDARLTLENLIDAQAHGARVLPRCALNSVTPDADGWRCQLSGTGGKHDIRARAVANVAGPWAPRVEALRGHVAQPGVRLVQGSHIVLDRLHDGDDAWLLQQPDRRVVFVIPYGSDFHLVGTTETDLESPDALGVTDAERTYLLAALSRAFGRRLGRGDIRWEFCGMRPLLAGAGSARTASREYRLELESLPGGQYWMSVQGGKLTTYRSLAEHAVDRLMAAFGRTGQSTTAQLLLPGAEGVAAGGKRTLSDAISREYPAFPSGWVDALLLRHGARTPRLLAEAKADGGAGRDFGGGLFEAEARWCRRHEWATEAEDVLWRRTKCGVRMSTAQRDEFARWWDGQLPF